MPKYPCGSERSPATPSWKSLGEIVGACARHISRASSANRKLSFVGVTSPIHSRVLEQYQNHASSEGGLGNRWRVVGVRSRFHQQPLDEYLRDGARCGIS